jgi:hypothetical protein
MFLNKSLKALQLLIFLTLSDWAFCQQDSSRMVKYTADFRFREGVFLNFDQVKQNNPVPKTRIVTSIPYDNPDFFDQVLREKKIFIFDNLGTRQEYSTANIWGYCRNGVLYISLNGGYFRITIIGNICHFVASLTTYSNNYYNPYYGYSYPYYSYPYSPYYSPYSSGGTQNSEMRQYVLDFKTGNVLEYEVKSIELLLMTDPVLHDEFTALSNKKKKQLKFMYIRKFNERNPLYFPEN